MSKIPFDLIPGFKSSLPIARTVELVYTLEADEAFMGFEPRWSGASGKAGYGGALEACRRKGGLHHFWGLGGC